MAFNDFKPTQTCPRCGRDTLDPAEKHYSLSDNWTPICGICHDEEPLYVDPWPGYPRLVNEEDLTSATVKDVSERHWRRAGIHGALNRPGPDGTRESHAGVLLAGRNHIAFERTTPEAFNQRERSATAEATNRLFWELDTAIKEVQR